MEDNARELQLLRAIVHKPALVLADEPTANLDSKNSHLIMEIMKKLNTNYNTSFIFATHDEKLWVIFKE